MWSLKPDQGRVEFFNTATVIDDDLLTTSIIYDFGSI